MVLILVVCNTQRAGKGVLIQAKILLIRLRAYFSRHTNYRNSSRGRTFFGRLRKIHETQRRVLIV
jgi:hypothetical protein